MLRSVRINLARKLLRYLLMSFAHLEIEGQENFPSVGPYIVAVNHLSVLDVPLATVAVPAPMFIIVKQKWKKVLPIFLYLRLFHQIIYFGKGDVEAYRLTINLLRRGEVIGIAPEGTRSRTKALQKAHKGVARLALDTLAPIVPMAMYGQEAAWYQWMRFQRPKIVIKIGKPIIISQRRRMDFEVLTTKVMCAIAEMLPSKYRGVYRQCGSRNEGCRS